jgi:hypothetical protein
MIDKRKVEKLMDDLLKPLWLYRANGPNNPHGHTEVRGKAMAEIDRIVLEYAMDRIKGEV